jgi:hypothetical protein
MLLIRLRVWLLSCLVLLATASMAHAQHWQPFGNLEWDDYNLQPFETPNLSEYGNGPQPNYGWFFQYDRMMMMIKPPTRTLVGAPDAGLGIFYRNPTPIPETDPRRYTFVENYYDSSTDTSWMDTMRTWGNRYEFGYMDEDDSGWFTSIIRLNEQSQRLTLLAPNIMFDDPYDFMEGFIPGDAGVYTFVDNFNTLVERQVNQMQGVEVNKSWRYSTNTNRSVWEMFLGVRYLQFKDWFELDAVGGIYGNFAVNSRAINNLVGPQVGVRWSHQEGRWIVRSEGRFMAAANWQNVRLKGNFASLGGPGQSPVGLQPVGFTDGDHDTEFSPVGELRVDLAFQITKAIAARVGYTGYVIGGITQGSRRIEYTMPYFGINENNKMDTAFVNGVTMGIEINR